MLTIRMPASRATGGLKPR